MTAETLGETVSRVRENGAAFQDAVEKFQAAMEDAGLMPLDAGLIPAEDDEQRKALMAEPQALQAAPLAVPVDSAAVQQVVADVKVGAVDAAAARTQVLVDAVEAVCDAIQVKPGVVEGQGEVRIQLKPEVLSGTEVCIEAKGSTLTVAFNPTTQDAAAILMQNITQFEQHLAGRIHNYQIAARVNVDDKKGLKGSRV